MPRSFFRLRYTDQPTGDPQNDDFDGDGLSNADEISWYSVDPFSADTDGDGLNDGVEAYFGTPIQQGPIRMGTTWQMVPR